MMANILIADDHIAQRMLLKSILSREGHNTLVAEDGSEALELLKTNPEVEILITDIDMPKMNGLELLEHLIDNTELIKLVVTAHTQPEYKERAKSLGADLVTKPLQSSAFGKFVNHLLINKPLSS